MDGEQHERSELQLSSLSDDELLHVLGFLSRVELLRCRMVCRRFRQLALHPAVWRRKILSHPKTRKLGATTLRVAPCLAMLALDDPDDVASLGVLLASSRCAVSTLCLALHPMDAVLVAVVLARQASFGRLKVVELRVTSNNVDEKSCSLRIRQLLQQLLSIQGLESIKVHLRRETAALLKGRTLRDALKYVAPVPSSLRRLEYFSTSTDPFLPLFLEWHAATLEMVQFRGSHEGTTSLLVTMPHLRELKCPVLEHMSQLLACKEIRTLDLYIPDETEVVLPEVAEYLRSAVATLEDLILEYQEGEERALAVDLVLSLAGTRRSTPALKKLRFVSRDDFLDETQEAYFSYPQLTLRPLAAVIHRLHNLVRLEILQPSDELLDAMDGEALPNLQVLSITISAVSEVCPHEWAAHGEHVRALMLRCPRLHIMGATAHGGVDDDCTFCEENTCHDVSDDFVVFSHPREVSCGVGHDALIEILVNPQ